MEAVQRFSELLTLLASNRVDCVVVGGVAAALGGAPVVTFDLDLVPNPDEANLERLLGLLREIDAIYLDAALREIRPDLEKLRSNRMNLLRTRLGRLDIAAEIGDGMRYDHLFRRSSIQQHGDLSVRILDLDVVIQSKEFANRDKDRATLPVLRETLRLSRIKDGDT